MEVQGTLVYDPVVYATGKNRARIIRRHAHELHALCRTFRHLLHGKTRRVANILDELLANDPNYWVRRKGQGISTPKHLDMLFQHAQEIERLSEYPAFREMINPIIAQINQDLVVTRREAGWAILEIPVSVVRPWLEEIRADGTHIGMSVWGPHISIVRGEWSDIRVRELWKSRAGETFTVEVSKQMRKNKAGYYWLPVKSRHLELLRLDMGLSPRPRHPFHLTIGKAS